MGMVKSPSASKLNPDGASQTRHRLVEGREAERSEEDR